MLNGEVPSIGLHEGLSPPTLFLLHLSCLISLGVSARLPTQGSNRLLHAPSLIKSLEVSPTFTITQKLPGGVPDLDDDRTYLSFGVFKIVIYV